MINLLPDYEIRDNLREYRRRRLVAAGFFGLAIMLAAILLNVSLFFVLKLKQKAVTQPLASLQAILAKDDEPEVTASLALVQKQLRRLGKTLDVEPRLTSALKAVLAHQIPGIRLLSLNYDRPEGKPVILRLSGLAATRPALLKFVDSLDTDIFFSVIESPVTNLIKDQNVDFSLSLTVKTKE